MKRENNNLRHRFCFSYSHTGAVRLEIRGNKLFFLKKSQPLWGRILVGASLDGFGKQTVLKADSDGGYNLNSLERTDQVITLYRNIPGSDYFSTYLRVPITFSGSDVCFHNTSAITDNTYILKRIATDKAYLQLCLKATEYIQSDEEQIKNVADKLVEKCTLDDYVKVMLVHDYVARYLFYDCDELNAKVRQDDSSLTVLKRRHTTCRGYASLSVSLLRAMGVPAQILCCYKANPGQMIDIKNITPKTNHEFVAAYADSRWIIFDPTLDSHNKYEKGIFYNSNEKPSFAHFDMTKQFLSFTHWLSENLI